MRRRWVAIPGVAVLVVAGGWWLTREDAVRAPVADVATAVDIGQGRVTGFVDAAGGYSWRGIPFAEPPVGALRWRAPMPPAAFDARFSALASGSACVQYKGPLADVDDPNEDGIVGSEDCLYLNVHAPAGATRDGARRPVMFWIHGGGNSVGHAGPYDGSVLATRHDVVVVATNYRLGPFGWFRHAALRDANAVDASGNFGTLDLVRALGWVRDNIAAFGGDPANVTVFGESAGGANVLSLMASPRAAGLFHRAVVQSGGLFFETAERAEHFLDDPVPGHERSSSEVLASLLVARGSAPGMDAARAALRAMDPADVRALLRDAPAPELMALYADGGMGMVSAPAVFGDGTVLPPGGAAELFADASAYNAVPLILGTNRDEVKLFMAMSPDWVDYRFGFLPRLKDPERYDRSAAYGSLGWRHDGVDGLARILHAAQGDSVYAYRFDWDEEGSILGYDLSQAMGAAHGLEIGFVFGGFDGSSAVLGSIYDEDRLPQRDALSASMMSYWAEFAHAGSPGRGRDGTEVRWAPWSNAAGAPKTIVFDTPRDGGIRMSAEEVTLPGLKARLLADASFADQRELCETYVNLFRDGPVWDEAEYLALGDAGCEDHPAEAFPRF